MITAVILAAGESSRMSAPKALLTLGNLTFAEVIVKKAREAGADFVSIVAGAHNYDAIRKGLPNDLRADVILNIHYKEGQITSLKEGVRNMPTGSLGALVWPVDHPLVSVDTIRMLLEIHKKGKQHVTIPVFESKKGHPVVYDIHAIQTILSFGRNKTAKDLMSIYANETNLVEVQDSGVLADIDTPELYRKYITDSGL